MSTTTSTQLVVDRSSANELLKINFNVRWEGRQHAYRYTWQQGRP